MNEAATDETRDDPAGRLEALVMRHYGGYEIRAVTCPQCNPKMDDPDYVRGYKDGLKYLLAGRKCRVCKMELVDLGPDDSEKAKAAFAA